MSCDDMRVNKENPERKKLCDTCVNKECAGNEKPCKYCWNPMGDMYVHDPQAEIDLQAALRGTGII